MDRLNRYEVHISSVPGTYAQYSGSVKVYAEDTEQAIERAFQELKRGAFPDRSRSMWEVGKIECIG